MKWESLTNYANNIQQTALVQFILHMVGKFCFVSFSLKVEQYIIGESTDVSEDGYMNKGTNYNEVMSDGTWSSSL